MNLTLVATILVQSLTSMYHEVSGETCHLTNQDDLHIHYAIDSDQIDDLVIHINYTILSTN